MSDTMSDTMSDAMSDIVSDTEEQNFMNSDTTDTIDKTIQPNHIVTSREQALADFIKQNENLPKQGSAEWLQQRNKSIGGSQIATILGINKYETMTSLVKSKAGISKFKKAPPLWFGNLMEYCVEQYVKLRWDATVVETGSITHTIDCISYSPDGLCVIKKSKLKEFTKKDFTEIQKTSMFEKDDELLVLMEFKSPFIRIPIVGQVPPYYIPQPQLGMCVIPITEVSLFIECVFRFCTREDLHSTQYSRYHYDKKRYNKRSIAFSAISVVIDQDNASEETMKMVNDLKSQIYDFEQMDIGTVQNKTIINSLLEQLVDGELTPIYHSLLGNQKDLFDDVYEWSFHKYNNFVRLDNEIYATREQYGDRYVGYLPYKLLDVNINKIFKKNILTDNVVEKTRKVITLANQISGEQDVKKQQELISQAKKM